jgi:hypothetical protein
MMQRQRHTDKDTITKIVMQSYNDNDSDAKTTTEIKNNKIDAQTKTQSHKDSAAKTKTHRQRNNHKDTDAKTKTHRQRNNDKR